MKLRGTLTQITRAYLSNRLCLTFEVDPVSGTEALQGKDLDVDARIHRERRSLDANAYFHKLTGELADALGISKIRCKNILIARYGQPMQKADGETVYIKTNIPQDEMMEIEYLHTSLVKVTPDACIYRVYKGSHEYDTKEMATLIDGLVQECKAQGIQTDTPEQIERMKALWSTKETPA